jgi:hypothetical protein
MSTVGKPPGPRGEIVFGSRRHRRLARRLLQKHWRTPMRWCDDCRLLQPEGPVLRDALWASFAQPDNVLCFPCQEKRLGRSLVQGDLTRCGANAGWIDFDETDLMAEQFARGRRRLPVGGSP